MERDYDALGSELIQYLQKCSVPLHYNSTASVMLFSEIAKSGKEVGAITLAEIAAMTDRVSERHKEMFGG